MMNKKNLEQLVRTLEASENKADEELLDVFLAILQSKLDEGQKRLLLYFLHAGLVSEVDKEEKTLDIVKDKIEHNPLDLYKKKLQIVRKTVSAFEEIQNKIGGILYDAVATEDATDNQIAAFDARFLNGETWGEKSDSSHLRKAKNTLRGFAFDLPKKTKKPLKNDHQIQIRQL